MPSKTAAPKKTTATTTAKKTVERKTVKGAPVTKAWLSKSGKEIAKNDIVKDPNTEITGTADWRWTKPTKAGRIPMIGILVESAGKGIVATPNGRPSAHVSVPACHLIHAAAPTKKPAKAKVKGASVVERAKAAADEAHALAA